MIYFLLAALAAALIIYGVILGATPNKRQRGSHRPSASSRGYHGYVDPSEIKVRWETIMATSRTGASGLKSAINEADKLFDYVMRQLGYAGETMAERLKVAGSKLSDQNSVWRAHKLRNALAHEVGFDLVASQANEALHDFERGLRDLGAL